MNKFYAKIVAGLLFLGLTANVSMAQTPLVSTAKKAELDQLSARLNNTYSAFLQKAQLLAPQHNWSIRKRTKNGTVLSLQRLTPAGFPIFYKTFNNVIAAATTRTTDVQQGGSLGLNLSGSSSFLNGKLGLWDGGVVYSAHQEFAGKNITLGNSVASDLHTTHVAGTMIAKGVYAPAKGMASNAATLLSYDFDNDIAEMSSAAPNLLLSNHSYGVIAGWNFNEEEARWEWYGLPGDTVDYKFGFYDADCQSVDQIANSAPYYLITVASGNNRGYTGPAVGQNYYGFRSRTDPTLISKGARPAGISSNNGFDNMPGFANAKNVLSVGAVNQLPYGPTSRQDATIAYFSSIGPTDDGRIKPDICGDGDAVLSTSNSSPTAYTTLSGTSMATPNVTGSLYLLQEYYAQQNNGSFMRSATLKALVCHTAFDAGNVGPDYTFGWGILDTRQAAQTITGNGTKSMIRENTLQQGQPQTITVVASGNGILAATIAWTDPQGSVSADGTINSRAPKLVNDLDIRVSDGNNTYNPWILDVNRPGASATRGDNVRDNVEQVLIENTVPGKSYTITITNKGTLQGGSQPYALVVTGVGGANYCASGPTSSADSRIDNFMLANISNTPQAGCTTYSNYTNLTAQLEQGQTYPLSIRLGTCGANFNKIARVFIDWNADGTFNNTDELVATTNVINGTGTYTTNITVPGTAVPGNYSLMRIVLVETNNAGTISACGSYNKGETQDYRVQFIQPAVNVAAISVSASTVGGACAGPSNISVRLKNLGSQAISNIPVVVTITPPNGQVITLKETYTGTLNSQAEDDFTLNGMFTTISGATYAVTAVATLPNDLVTNDNQVSANLVTGSIPVPTDLAAYHCDDSKQYLLTGSGTGQLLWYTTPTGGTPVALGNNALTATTPVNNTYYAGLNDFSASVGPATKNVIADGTYTQATSSVQVTTKIPVVIKSARMYIGNSGSIRITVTNANGEVVATRNFNVTATRTTPGSGIQPNDPNDAGKIYNLNLLLPNPDTYNISIAYGGGATVFRNNSGTVAYPFSIGNIFSITRNDAVSPTNPSDTTYYRNFYYYFYDMQVASAGCASVSRQAVTVTSPVITQNGTTLVSSMPSGNQWYLNGTAIAGATGQTFRPAQSGNYQLINVLTTGCTAISPVYTYLKTDGVVNGSADIGLSVYPVPATTTLNFGFEAPTTGNLILSLINSTGQVVYNSKSTVSSGKYYNNINVSNLAPGTYVLRLILGQKVYSSKVIIGR
ncbi:S8 family peptidase [Mucilaginibacter sp. Bleaf8]|uniref:S8 family serine peptidase n=1 Tax=Mucilaginibacter sp. Bleaf8 TaxID=2834430 RepID=UPI001BD0750A|nr:S8 family serine peptidase [Mucilaginibacter sp. Bleaf8]MBS7564302.1 S8 family peptidase [Mucilaginibacter sp. Bleaf8]